jgi:ubiquinone/menaquinone biosynthesis C-methylase UbiE
MVMKKPSSRCKTGAVENVGRGWAGRAKRYDKWYETFWGSVENYVDWEILKRYLPENRDAKILDIAGGTGRITLPLVRMGYSVTLCDICPEMLDVARRKMLREGVSDRVDILECDVRKLRFADESYDFVICWDGMIEAAKELVRVTRKGGKISIFLMNKWGAAIDRFHEDPDSALALLRSGSRYVFDEDEKHMAVDVEEARRLFEKEGIKVIDIYAVCGLAPLLSISKRIRASRTWDKTYFRQVTEMLLRLSQESSTKGLSKHLVLYGERS